MKTLYTLLAIIGFIAPNILVVIESLETGNWLLLLDPAATLNGMFGNRIAAAFTTDLLFVVLTALIWMYFESRKVGVKNYLMYVVITFLFGLAGTLPLFLREREKKLTP